PIGIDNLSLSSSGLCDTLFAGVQKAQCIWVASGESVSMQWDVNVCANIDGAPVTLRKLAPDPPNACSANDAITDPPPACSSVNACYTGQVEIDGNHRTVFPPWGSSAGAPAQLLKCRGGTSNPVLNDCQQISGSCIPLEHQECQGAQAPNNYPYCSEECSQQIASDEAIEIAPASPLPSVLVTSPTFFAVADTRTIVRPAAFSSADSSFETGELT